MKRSTRDLKGYTIQAKDGNIGHVKDFYFDDRSWTLRYLVVDTGTWLTGRKVILSPAALEKPNWEHKIFPVNLTKSTIEDSPGIDEHKPVSRQQEDILFRYFNWRPYWGSGLQPGVMPSAIPPLEDNETEENKEPHLRSTNEIVGYHIETTDGSIGHVEDIIIDDSDWKIRYFVVDTRNFLPGKKVIISNEWIESVVWNEKKIKIGLPREAVKNSPEYNPSVDLDKEYEGELFNHYGKLKHW